MNKKADALVILISSLILILILITGFSFFISNPLESDSKTISPETPDVEKENESSTTQESSNSDQGSMGEGSSEETTLDSLTCTTKQISYSMENLNQTSQCNNYSEGICVNQTVDCFVEIHNRDPETSGLFKIELSFLEKGENREDRFDPKIKNFTLSPMHFDLFGGSTTIQSTGEDGLANKEINCFYDTLIIPTKEVCE